MMVANYFCIWKSISPHPAGPLRAEGSIHKSRSKSNAQVSLLVPILPLHTSEMSHSTGSSKFDSIPYHNKVYPEIDPSHYTSSTFSGKIILITGSGRGIGKHLGLAFASLGARVCFTDLTLEPAQLAADLATQLHRTQTLAVQADIRNYSDLERLYKECVDKLGEVDVLINNAGYGDF